MRPLRLPVCPHCGARFLYRQVGRTKGDAQGSCSHCGGKFMIVYKRQRLFLFLGAGVLAIIMNFLLLRGLQVNSLIPLFIVTLPVVVIAVLLVPFAVRYRKRPPKAGRREKAKDKRGTRSSADREKKEPVSLGEEGKQSQTTKRG